MDGWDTVSTERYVGDSEVVVVLGRYSGIYKATGKPMDVPVAHAWTLKDGQIVKFRQYVDTLVVQQATR